MAAQEREQLGQNTGWCKGPPDRYCHLLLRQDPQIMHGGSGLVPPSITRDDKVPERKMKNNFCPLLPGSAEAFVPHPNRCSLRAPGQGPRSFLLGHLSLPKEEKATLLVSPCGGAGRRAVPPAQGGGGGRGRLFGSRSSF